MFGVVNYTGFLLSSVLLNITPGSDIIYVISRSLAGGRKQGVASALGIVTGILIHTLLVALGLSALLASSPVAFHIMKWLGAIYLTVMGIRTIGSDSLLTLNGQEKKKQSMFKIYRQGVLTNALNPKVAMFFLAFLPQFVETGNPYGALPFLILGLTFFTTSTIWCLILAFGSSFLNQWLIQSEKAQKMMTKLSGVVYIALGLNLLRAEL
jgi:threonine/homoserine/homoserine lactone efflux protein